MPAEARGEEWGDWMRSSVFAFALIAVLSLSFAQSFSNPIPMTGTLDLTFVDVNGNPVSDATIDYTYIVSGTGYTPDTPATGTGVTDANGHFSATITADARQTIPFKINLTYQGVLVLHDESSSWLTYADRPARVRVNVGALSILVKDQKGRPIPGVPLEISGGRGSTAGVFTDSKGAYAISGAEPGVEYTIVARYGNSEVTRKMSPPATMELEMPAYDVVVRSLDDKGGALAAGLSINITTLNRKVSGSGEIALGQIPMGDIYVTARFGKAFAEKKITVLKDSEESIILDLNAPQISSVVIDPPQPGEGEVTVSASVDDGANGVGISNVVLKYSVDGGVEIAAAMSNQGTAYSAIIPRQPGGSVVTYYVEAADRNGNALQSDPGNYIVKYGAAAGGGKAESGVSLSGLLPVVGAIGIIAIAGFIYWRRRMAGNRPPISI